MFSDPHQRPDIPKNLKESIEGAKSLEELGQVLSKIEKFYNPEPSAAPALGAGITAYPLLVSPEFSDPKHARGTTPKTTYRCIRKGVDLNNSTITCVQGVPYMDVAITGNSRGEIQCWWPTGNSNELQPQTLKGHSGSITCLHALSLSTILSGSADGTLRLWRKDPANTWQSAIIGTQLGIITSIQATVSDAPGQIDRQVTSIISSCRDGIIRIWRENGAGQWEKAADLHHADAVLTMHADIYKKDMSADQIVSQTKDGTIYLWEPPFRGDIPLSNAVKIYKQSPPVGTGVLYMKSLFDPVIISAGYDDAVISISKLNQNGEWKTKKIGKHPDFNVRALSGHTDQTIVYGDSFGEIRILHKNSSGFSFLREYTSQHWPAHNGAVNCVHYLEDGKIVSGGEDFTVKIWDGERPIPRSGFK